MYGDDSDAAIRNRCVQRCHRSRFDWNVDQYTDLDLTPRDMHIRSNLEKTGYIQNDDFLLIVGPQKTQSCGVRELPTMNKSTNILKLPCRWRLVIPRKGV